MVRHLLSANYPLLSCRGSNKRRRRSDECCARPTRQIPCGWPNVKNRARRKRDGNDRRTSSTSLVQLSMTYCGCSVGRYQERSRTGCYRIEVRTHTSPFAVIIASIVPIRIHICKSEHLFHDETERFTLSIANSEVLSSNVKSRMSITSPRAATHSDVRVLDLAMWGRERTFYFRPAMIPWQSLHPPARSR